MRAYKNRFGTTSEIGAFRMEAEGLIEVRDISASFLENREDKTQGSVTTAIYEGSRPVMFEMQALVSPANVGFARRTAVGVDNTRLNMILAVLEKIVGMPLGKMSTSMSSEESDRKEPGRTSRPRWRSILRSRISPRANGLWRWARSG